MATRVYYQRFVFCSCFIFFFGLIQALVIEQRDTVALGKQEIGYYLVGDNNRQEE